MSHQQLYPPYPQHPAPLYPSLPGPENAQGHHQGHQQMGPYVAPYHPQHHPYPNHHPQPHPAQEAQGNPYPDLPPLDDEELPLSIIPGNGSEVEGGEQRGNNSKPSKARAIQPPAPQSKPFRTPAANGKTPVPAAVPAKRKAGGRAAGSANFTDEEIAYLMKLIEDVIPVGADGWEAISASFNTQAKKKQRPERDAQSLKNKFDRMVNAAGKKPTGKAYRDPALETALHLSEMIDARASTELMGGSEDGDGSEVEDEEDDDEVEIVEKPKKVAKVEGERTSKVVKAYKANRPSVEDLQSKPRRSGGPAAATQVLSSISEFFNPAAAQERDGARLMSSFQMMQLTSLQNEKRHLEERMDRLRDEHRREVDRLRDVHAREIGSLRERLYQERSRADRLETHARNHRAHSWHDDSHHYRSSSPYERDVYSPPRSPRLSSTHHSPLPSTSTYRMRSPPARSYSPRRSFSSPTPHTNYATRSYRATFSPTKDTNGQDVLVVSQVEKVDNV